MPQLHQLIYASRQTQDFETRDLLDICKKAMQNNVEAGISGVLCYGNQRFLQAIEGPRDWLNRIFFRISRDRRHEDIELIAFHPISARRFPSWTMRLLELKLVPDSDLDTFLTLHTPQGKFTPETFTSEEGLKFALALSGRLDAQKETAESEALAKTGA